MAGDQFSGQRERGDVLGAEASIDHIRVLGLAGNDSIKMDTTVTQATELEGGDGNDRLRPARGRRSCTAATATIRCKAARAAT